MLLFALAVIATSPVDGLPPPQTPGRAIRQATATVRILAGERIGAGKLPETAIVTDTVVKDADGSEKPARLVEFP